MRTRTRLVLIGLAAVAALAASPARPATGRLGTFLSGLERTANAHDWKRMLDQYVDPEYVKAQHDKLLGGRNTQFFYELLVPNYRLTGAARCSGCNDYRRDEAACKACLDRIRSFRVVRFTDPARPGDTTTLEVEYEIGVKGVKISVELYLRRLKDPARPYGIGGASG
jgi:hypothetical protein